MPVVRAEYTCVFYPRQHKLCLFQGVHASPCRTLQVRMYVVVAEHIVYVVPVIEMPVVVVATSVLGACSRRAQSLFVLFSLFVMFNSPRSLIGNGGRE